MTRKHEGHTPRKVLSNLFATRLSGIPGKRGRLDNTDKFNPMVTLLALKSSEFSFCLRRLGLKHISTFRSPSKAAIVLCCLFAATGAPSQIDSGTVVVVGYSQRKIIVAADSRISHSEGGYDDTACKIIALNQQLIFVPFGKVWHGSFGITDWDAVREAKAALLTATKDKTVPADFMHMVAAEWSKKMTHELAQRMTEDVWQSLGNRRPIVSGYFFGLDEHGNIETVGGKVFWSQLDANTRQINWKLDEPKSIGESTKFQAFGEGDVFNELMAGHTERAKQETNRLETEVAGMSLSDSDIHMAIRYVELSIKYAPHPDIVGGSVDVVELDRGGTLYWIHRKLRCRDEQPDTKLYPPTAPEPN
jgi:hypothetical protein